jgi:hypothetical protein
MTDSEVKARRDERAAIVGWIRQVERRRAAALVLDAHLTPGAP